MQIISFITPDDPDYRKLKHRKNTVVMEPEPIGQIIPSVLKKIVRKNFVKVKKNGQDS